MTAADLREIPPVTVAVARLEPGDVIVVEFPLKLTPDAMDQAVEVLADVFPKHRAVVLDGGATLKVARAILDLEATP